MIREYRMAHFGYRFVATCSRCGWRTRAETRRADAADDLATHTTRRHSEDTI